MTPDEPSDECTPLMPAAPTPFPTPEPDDPPADLRGAVQDPARAEPVTGSPPASTRSARVHTIWPLIAAAAAATVSWALVDPPRAPEPSPAAALADPGTAASSPHVEPEAAAAPPLLASDVRPRSPAPPGAASRRARPRPSKARVAAPRSPPSSPAPPTPVELAGARYLAGDLVGARAALAGARGETATALLTRLDAIARLLGESHRWPPAGGAAALERLLELDAAVAPPGTSPIARRARRSLADDLSRKGHGLADEGRWEEALEAFEEAADLERDHARAVAGLDRVEAEAQARYLEAYASEDADLDAARRLYERAARLARPGGALAGRIAGALDRLSQR